MAQKRLTKTSITPAARTPISTAEASNDKNTGQENVSEHETEASSGIETMEEAGGDLPIEERHEGSAKDELIQCIGAWTRMGLVEVSDIKDVSALPDVVGEEEPLAEDWDTICFKN